TVEVPRLFLVNQGFVPLVWSMDARDAITGAPAPWVAAVPETGSVAPHTQQVLSLRLRARPPPSGVPHPSIAAHANDPLHRVRGWNLSLSVPAAGNLVAGSALGFGSTYSGDTLALPLVLSNTGEGPVYLRGAGTRTPAF